MKFSKYGSYGAIYVVKLLGHVLYLSFQISTQLLLPLESLIINLDLTVDSLDPQAEPV